MMIPGRKNFNIKTLDDLRSELDALNLSLPIDTDFSVLGESVDLNGRQTPNRFVALPMEGFDSDEEGTPGELSFRRYRRYAVGGTGLIWFEATAVLHEARSNPHQLWLHEGNVDTYARLVEQTKQTAREHNGHEIKMIVQLTHSGRYSKPTGIPQPLIAHRSPILDPKHGLPDDYPVVTDDYLDRLQDTFVSAVKLAAQAGFDGIDVKSCHRYLVSELLASHTREGKYGGSLENRSRMLRETLARIRDEVPEVFVTTRMNVFDAIDYPYGFGVSKDDYNTPDLTEQLELIGMLKEIGVPLLNTSIGNPYFNPHYGRPYDRPIAGVTPPNENQLAGVVRFLNITRQIQQAYPDLPIVGGGYTWLRHMMPFVAAGVVKTGGATLIGQGRGMFAYPDSVNDILKNGAMDPNKACITCSGCTQIMRDGTMTGCVVRDSEIYAEQYHLGRRFSLDRLLEEAKRCQNCAFPTCSVGCPASVDIPRFLNRFLEKDFGGAYDVLRETNVLPEMCGCVCPAEVQCEGNCIERVFSEKALPIRDIQLVVSQIARRNGLTGVRIPETATGKKIAVVGGGPSGIACAIRLLEKGHSVTLIDKSDHLGGTPDFVIPNFRYQKASAEVDAILAPAIEAGRVELRLGCAFGEDISLDDLRETHDAVYIALGLGQSKSLGKADGVVDAISFLEKAKNGSCPDLKGKTVAVLGGGNTAMDAASTAKRLGADDVFIVYRRSFSELPAWKTEWTEAQDLGIHFMILTQPQGYETDVKGNLVALKTIRTVLSDKDSSGRRSPILIEGTEASLPVDMVVEAMGQSVPEAVFGALAALERTARGFIITRHGSQATTLERVFAGGDIVNGGTTAVQAIREGMNAADEIDESFVESEAVSS